MRVAALLIVATLVGCGGDAAAPVDAQITCAPEISLADCAMCGPLPANAACGQLVCLEPDGYCIGPWPQPAECGPICSAHQCCYCGLSSRSWQTSPIDCAPLFPDAGIPDAPSDGG